MARCSATLNLCRELYNAALQERRDAYQINGLSINYHAQAVQLPQIKQVREDVGEVHSQVLQDALRRVKKAFDAFFRRCRNGEAPGYPRFKPASRYDSFTYPQSGFRLELATRIYSCSCCGLVIDRDRNGAINIKGRAGLSGMVPVGESREPRISTYNAALGV